MAGMRASPAAPLLGPQPLLGRSRPRQISASATIPESESGSRSVQGEEAGHQGGEHPASGCETVLRGTLVARFYDIYAGD